MKSDSARAIALGLSTITLASTVTFPVQAEASENSESLVLTPSDNEVSTEQSEEATVVQEAETLSESVNDTVLDTVNDTEVPEAVSAKDNIEEATEAVNNIEKAKEAMDDSVNQQETVSDIADDAAAVAEENAAAASSAADNAKADVVAKDTSKAEAVIIISETEKSVEQAANSFDEARASYDNALNSLEAAKDDYMVAVEAYNSNKNKATSDLAKANDDLAKAEAKMAQMQKELEAARQALVDAGAEALVAADDNKADAASYVETIVKYYYVPKQELSDGQHIADFTVGENNGDYISISYNVVDDAGNILRNVTADYGYTIDKATGEISIFDNKLYYEYTNADGQVVRLTKEEAANLENNRIEIGKYWTATGAYIPRYEEQAVYQGFIPFFNYSDAKAIAQGKEEIESLYATSPWHYNANADFVEGTKTPLLVSYALNIKYNVSYDQVETYYIGANKIDYATLVDQYAKSGRRVISSSYELRQGIVRYIQEYKISDDIAGTEFDSYKEAIAAVVKEAGEQYGASNIDIANSTQLAVKENTKYADVFEKHINEGAALFRSLGKDYTSYITNVRAQLLEYTRLLSEVSAARTGYADAKAKVANLQGSIEKLNNADDVATAVQLAELQAKLDKAKIKLDIAKDNLDSAKESLSEAKLLFNKRFNTAPAVPTTNSVQEEIIEAIPIEETEVEKPEELEELIEENERKPVNRQNNNNNSSTSENSLSDGQSEEGNVPSEDNIENTIITIPEEETPKAITVAGLLARGKWFIGLAGVSTAGIGVAVLEAKHRAAIKLLDKLNQ